MLVKYNFSPPHMSNFVLDDMRTIFISQALLAEYLLE